jgi:hypothetical protein
MCPVFLHTKHFLLLGFLVDSILFLASFSSRLFCRSAMSDTSATRLAMFSPFLSLATFLSLAYNSYTAVLTTFFPSRSRDLLAYMALIIRTAKRFGGKAWLEYDRAFRREAAANSLRDWSLMRPDLYNYHTALADRTVAISNEADQSSERSFREEPRGKPSAKQFCISWNKGFCRSTYQFCRFRHNCSSRVQWPAPSHRTRIQCYNSTLL